MKHILPYVTKPGRYIGKELNESVKKLDDLLLHGCLVFPDLYEIGMSHQGIQILYHLLNNEPSIYAERAFCPDIDTEKLLQARGERLSTLETSTPLASLDFVGITLPHELCYTNILTILNSAGIEFLTEKRSENEPIILGGGACAFNPEPVADFFDAILLGDGEEGVIEIVQRLTKAKKDNLSRAQKLRILSTIESVYVPSHISFTYGENGSIKTISSSSEQQLPITKRVLPSIETYDHLLSPLVPNTRIVHDRLGIEIARGCTRGCRFCQAGITYRPVRERSVEQILDIAERSIESSGFEELALLSLSTGDYSCMSDLLPELMKRYSKKQVSVSLPSMRVGTLTPEMMDEIRQVRKTGFTLAPEAGSDRLRSVINKGITENDLLETAENAFTLGWNHIKLYFMIGLPTETDEDIQAIAELAKKIIQIGAKRGRGRSKVTISVGTFVPKPHTPFQWAGQLSLDQSREKINQLKRILPKKGIKLKWQDPEQSYLEGVFSRGDRKLSELIIKAWEKGARLDSWSDHFNFQRWCEVAEDCGIEPAAYLQERGKKEIFPWSHLDTGVDVDFLDLEHQKSLTQTYTPDCRYHGCQQCGLCDFETIEPLVFESGSSYYDRTDSRSFSEISSKSGSDSKFRYLVSYERLGPISYLGHLDFLQVIFRSLRRAKIETAFSQGFNPSPKISFGPAMPVGTESLCEIFIMELTTPLEDPNAALKTLNDVLPQGMKATSLVLTKKRIPQTLVSEFLIKLSDPLTQDEQSQMQRFFDSKEWLITRTRKGRTQKVNIRELILDQRQDSDTELTIKILTRTGQPGVKPLEALQQMIGREADDLLSSMVRKMNWQELDLQT